MKTNLDKFFKLGDSHVENGVWFMIDDSTGFLVKPFNQTNQATKAAMAKHYKPFARQIEMGTLSESKEREILAKVFVGSCLVDWKGIVIDGEEKEFSKEIAASLLSNRPELFQTLMNYASDMKNYREEEAAEVGNS